jgi:hypothetical protein
MYKLSIVETNKPDKGIVRTFKQAWNGTKKGRAGRVLQAVQKYVVEKIVKSTIPKCEA